MYKNKNYSYPHFDCIEAHAEKHLRRRQPFGKHCNQEGQRLPDKTTCHRGLPGIFATIIQSKSKMDSVEDRQVPYGIYSLKSETQKYFMVISVTYSLYHLQLHSQP